MSYIAKVETHFYDNGQKMLERRYNDDGQLVSYDSWHENGQK